MSPGFQVLSNAASVGPYSLRMQARLRRLNFHQNPAETLHIRRLDNGLARPGGRSGENLGHFSSLVVADAFAGALTRGSFKTIPASEETTNTQRFEADSPADETVSGEPVSVWKFPAFRKMQGVFEKMQRGANCTRAQRGHFSITCIAFSLLEEQGGVIALAGTLRLPSGLGDSSTVEQWTRFHGRRNCPDGARVAQGVFLVQDQHRRASRRKSCRRRPWFSPQIMRGIMRAVGAIMRSPNMDGRF